MCARLCHSRDFFFCLRLQAPDVPSGLLSGEQTQQLKGRASHRLEPRYGHCLHTPLPKGFPAPFLRAQESQRAKHHRASAVQQVARLAWWQKRGRGFCQGWLLWFLPSPPCASPPVRGKSQGGPVAKEKLRLGASATTLSPQSFPFMTLYPLWIFSLKMWEERKLTCFPGLGYKKKKKGY